MKRRIYDTVLGLMAFWIVTDLFTGIEIREGLAGRLIVGGIYGVTMSVVVPLIRFFTLPVKIISLFLVAVMLSVIIFFIYNFAVPFINFGDGQIDGLENSFFQIPAINLNMIGNVIIAGVITGVFVTFLKLLQGKD
ncbi:MAG: hypothetical protein HXY24_10505 [Rubrivivax sp.]|nr:hypothetical protein [Rubrivivax sp.]